MLTTNSCSYHGSLLTLLIRALAIHRKFITLQVRVLLEQQILVLRVWQWEVSALLVAPAKILDVVKQL